MDDAVCPTILIIDDNHEFVKSLSNLVIDVMDNCTPSVKWVANIYDGAEQILSTSFSYIFLNVKMENIDNLWITKSITSDRQSYTQIIALSYHTEAFFREEVLRAGAHQYLVKDSIDHQSLADILQNTNTHC